MDEAVTVRPKGRQEVSAIEELEKLASDMEPRSPELAEHIRVISTRLLSEVRERPVGAGRTEAEVRERERAAYEQGFKDCERGMTLAIETERRYPNA